MTAISPDLQTEEMDHYLFLLQDIVWRILEGTEEKASLKKRFGDLFRTGYPGGLQLPRTYLALISHLLHLDPLPIDPEQFPNGAALLDALGWCPSRKIPEPIELAQLGVLWMVLGVCLKNETLQRAGVKVAVWQVHLLDLQGLPHVSLWAQARSFRPSLLSLWNYTLFTMAYRLSGQGGFQKLADIAKGEAWDPKAFPIKLLAFVPSTLSQALSHHFRPFAEEMTMGLMKFSTPDISLMAHLSGWNSGLFSFHKKEVAIVNAGPQVGPYDALDQFGICRTWSVKERPFQEMVWEKTAYHCHLGGWTQLFAAPLWLELQVKLQAGQVFFETTLQEKTIEKPLSMVLFVKSPKLILAGKSHLESGSLERYEGKALPLELQGSQEKIIIHPDPHLTMQVIPLAGGDYFWGADFLIAFPLSHEQSFKMELK